MREDNEWKRKHAKDAVHPGRGIIERDIIGKYPDKNAELILYGGRGFHPALSAYVPQKMGCKNVWAASLLGKR